MDKNDHQDEENTTVEVEELRGAKADPEVNCVAHLKALFLFFVIYNSSTINTFSSIGNDMTVVEFIKNFELQNVKTEETDRAKSSQSDENPHESGNFPVVLDDSGAAIRIQAAFRRHQACIQ